MSALQEREAIHRGVSVVLNDLIAYVVLSMLGVAVASVMLFGNISAGPILTRFLVGLVVFGFSPGFLIFILVNLGKRNDMDTLTRLLSIVSLSFSCNLLLNVVLFLTSSSFEQVTKWYVVLQVLAYACLLLGLRLSPGQFAMLRSERAIPLSVKTVAFALIAAAALATVLTVSYVKGAPPVNPEELIVLRKLAENPSVRFDNISVAFGQPSTYLFTPFQVFIVGVSKIGAMDVALTYSLFWAFTTIMSIVCLVKLTWVVSSNALAALIMALISLGVALFDPLGVIYALGIVMPYPNRYGFASGVLLPLNILLFWLILKRKTLSPVLIGLLVYLSVEMTFVHAKETIFLLAIMGTAGLTFAANDSRQEGQRMLLRRIAAVIGLTAMALIVYKVANLSLASQLNIYVDLLGRQTQQALSALISQQGLLQSLLLPGPTQIAIPLQDFTTTHVTAVPGYSDVFASTWNDGLHLSRLVLPITLLALPIYIWRAHSVAEIALGGSLTFFALLSSSGLLKLGVSALVGNPEILGSQNIVYIIAFLIFAHMIARLAAHIVVALGAAGRRTAGALVISALVGLMLAFGLTGVWLSGLVGVLAWLWASPFPFFLHTATSLAVVAKCAGKGLLSFPEELSPKNLDIRVVATGVVSASLLMGPMVATSDFWKHNPFTSAFPPSQFTGAFSHDYGLLVKSGKLPSAYPLDVVSVLREQFPPNQTVLSKDTLSLAVATTHYAGVLTTGGAVSNSYIMNWEYLLRHSVREGSYDLTDYLSTRDRFASLQRLLRDLRIDVVVADPKESAAVAPILERDADLQRILTPAYSGSGYTVYRVLKTGVSS